MFKVYKRKIHVFMLDEESQTWRYFWSTNAYPTCKAAVAGAVALHPEKKFKANFAKD